MIGRTHDLAAFATLSLVVLSQPPRSVTLVTAIMAVLASLIGGIAPDIDQPTAPFWRNLPIGKYFGRLFGMLNGGHRFVTHSLLGVALFAVVVRWFLLFIQPIAPRLDGSLVCWAFVIGMLSHLVMDSLTKEGVPWLLPLPVKFGFPPIKALRITADKRVEAWLVFPGLVVFTILVYLENYQKVLVILRHNIR